RASPLTQVERDPDRPAVLPRVLAVGLVHVPVVRACAQSHRGWWGHAARGKDRPVAVDDKRRVAADQTLGPAEGPLGERGAVRAVEQEVVHRPPVLVFLWLTPDPAQPGGREERDVKDWDDGQRRHAYKHRK